MSLQYLTNLLNDMANPKRDNRQKVANSIIEDISLFKYLVDITFDVDNKLSIKAAWILEWICTHHQLNYILPYLDKFSSNISRVYFDSATRPCAKICEHLAVSYYSKKTNLVQEFLKENHIDQIIETGFDWLLTPQKIAVRAYTMNTLYYFGLDKKWVHPELKHLISTKIMFESKGCKARGKHILMLIEKQNTV